MKREIIYLSLHCHLHNGSCIKMGSDESHFNVSLIVMDEVTRQCPQTATFEEKGEPKRIRTEVPLLTSQLGLTARPNRLTRDGRPGPDSAYGFGGRKTTLNVNELSMTSSCCATDLSCWLLLIMIRQFTRATFKILLFS